MLHGEIELYSLVIFTRWVLTRIAFRIVLNCFFRSLFCKYNGTSICYSLSRTCIFWKLYPPGKLTWQWKIHHLKRYFLLKIVIFQCHVSFRGCNWSTWTSQSTWGSPGPLWMTQLTENPAHRPCAWEWFLQDLVSSIWYKLDTTGGIFVEHVPETYWSLALGIGKTYHDTFLFWISGKQIFSGFGQQNGSRSKPLHAVLCSRRFLEGCSKESFPSIFGGMNGMHRTALLRGSDRREHVKKDKHSKYTIWYGIYMLYILKILYIYIYFIYIYIYQFYVIYIIYYIYIYFWAYIEYYDIYILIYAYIYICVLFSIFVYF